MTNEALRAALLGMYHDDVRAVGTVYARADAYRQALQASQTDTTTTPWPYVLFEWAPADQAPEEVRTALRIVRRNTAALKALVTAYGWPGRGLVGEDGANAAWLILQHAGSGVSTIGTPENHAFRRSCVPLLEQAVRCGQAHPRHLAYVVDGIRDVAGELPCYAVLTSAYTVIDGQAVLRFAMDVDEINYRRAVIGLRPLHEDLRWLASGDGPVSIEPDMWEPWPDLQT